MYKAIKEHITCEACIYVRRLNWHVHVAIVWNSRGLLDVDDAALLLLLQALAPIRKS